ncbi:hypothetical protein ACRDNQ_06585 [Palleronia sp. KMU-117]|uniref:hypothetical protein n=1 Tax=Palleronia sp. KMU-117 TaxID=3434108 RepID=UPI003D713134
MIFEFIATVVSGFAAGGIAMALRRLSGGRLPKWLTPAAAGTAMIAFAIWSEYSWFARTSNALPDSFVVVSQNSSSAPWRPWTYLRPMTDRFAAIDTASIRKNASVPDLRLADTYFWGRWAPVNMVTVAFDCAGHRRAPMVEGITLADDGAILGATWLAVPPDDPTLAAACAEG